MTIDSFVVLEDVDLGKAGRFALGDVVDGAHARLVEAERRGVVPHDPRAGEHHHLASWAHRQFGIAGLELPETVTGRVAPLTLFSLPGKGRVVWRARVAVGPGSQGRLRLTGDSAQPGANAAGVQGDDSPTGDVADLERDYHGDEAAPGQGTVLLRGTVRVSAPLGHYMGVCLYGAVSGARLLWFAASQVPA